MKYFGGVCLALSMLAGCSSVDRGDFGNFQRSLNDKSYGYTLVTDPLDPNNPRPVERFEVRSGDCSRDKDWDDCHHDRERSELSQRTSRVANGDEVWYAWEVYFPVDYQNLYPIKSGMGQFHQEKAPPVFMFQNQAYHKFTEQITKGGYHLDYQIGGQTDTMWELLKDEDLRGKWHRIEIHAKWSSDYDGIFYVWVNNELKVKFHGRTLENKRAYFKYGIYRTHVSRYKRYHNTDTVPTQVVYYRNVAAGDSRAEIQPEILQ
ncbi:polysaccharide lyase [Photobacterium sp. TY1-4]|uniref:polysaccharide lyase n=1 Tax=Photobacterium sp. TY1-4 TaxID=2899122 RepID=UPI0021C05046|nr:polysaccharide lyase [Photobacterium sp. TY1-4]UXI03008.1 polysaccharide lyase [Photobacterium sp. TY1-4]